RADSSFLLLIEIVTNRSKKVHLPVSKKPFTRIAMSRLRCNNLLSTHPLPMGLHPGVFLKAENGLCIKLVFIYFQPYTFRQTTQNPRRSLFQPVGHASVVSGMIAPARDCRPCSSGGFGLRAPLLMN